MAWDKTLPTNSTKIRDYPDVLTNNFTAIEEGVTTLQNWKFNLIQRNAIPSAPAVTPARIDNVMQLFAKQNAASRTDLYVLDDRATANTIQITQDGKLGGQSQDVRTAGIFFGSDTLSHGAWSVPNIVGSVINTGSGTYSIAGWSQGLASAAVVTISSIDYVRVTFAGSRITNTNYVVQVTPTQGTSNTRIAAWKNKLTTSVDIRITNQNSSDEDASFDIVIWGGR